MERSSFSEASIRPACEEVPRLYRTQAFAELFIYDNPPLDLAQSQTNVIQIQYISF